MNDMIQIDFYDLDPIRDVKLTYVVMCVRYRNQWIFVRHQDRTTWEIPGGHIEPGETPDEAAARELYEETGALKYSLKAVCDYSVTGTPVAGFGRLYFAEVEALNAELEFEIAEIRFGDELPGNLTYAAIQPVLFAEVRRRLDL
jgi:8-oxo-dGTP diphosphatase